MAAANLQNADELSADHEIISFMETDVLFGFDIETETLRNWQIELSDVAVDPVTLKNATSQDLVLQFPPGPIYFNEKQKKALEKCLSRLDALDSDVYIDFKMIIYEVLTRATTGLYTCKIQLLRNGFLDFLVDDFCAYTRRLDDNSSDHQILIYGAKARLLHSFLDLGCHAKQFRKLVIPLFGQISKISYTAKRRKLDFLAGFLNRCPSTYSALVFNNFLLRPVTIPINNESCISKCFSVSSWLKINDISSPSARNEEFLPITLLSLANSADHEHLDFQIQLWNGKFVINIRNGATRSKRQFTFNHVAQPYTSKNQGFTHFVLTYDIYQNLNLYIDGEYCESIPCSSISKADIRWNKLYIGDPIEASDRDHVSLNLFEKRELMVKDLAVMNTSLSFEWISLFYYLGLNFDWSHKEFSESNIVGFLDSLKKREYVLMSYRAKEILNSKRQQVSHRGDTRSNLSISRNRVSISASDYQLPTKHEIASLLASAQLRTSHYLFDVNDSQFVEFIAHSKSQEIISHRSNSFCGSLYSWGGSGLLLSLIETVMKDSYSDENQRHILVFESLKLLLLCLQKDWRIGKEFENIDGYWALALILGYYKNHYNPDLSLETSSDTFRKRDDQSLALAQNSFLALLLGYSTAKQNANIFICDFLAFKILALNFDLFSNTAGFSDLRSVMMDLLATERYKYHNFKELTRIKVLKKLLQHTKASFFEKSAAAKVEDLTTLLSVVINFELSVESIKSVSQFVIFALYNADSDEVSQSAGLSVLLALTNKLCGPSSSIKMLKKFSRSISIHWILLLLDFEGESKRMSARVVCCAIGLLAKFLRALGPNVIRRFFRANRGLDVMSYFLQKWWNNDSVISTIFMNSFGVDSDMYGGDIPTLPDLMDDKRITNGNANTAIPDYVNLLNGLALAGAIQLGQNEGKVLSSPSSPTKVRSMESDRSDHSAELSFDLMHLLNQMADMIERGLSEFNMLQAIFTSKPWLESAFEIVAHLKVLQETGSPASQVTANFKTCATRYVSVLSRIFVSMILDPKKLLAIMGSVSDITKKLVLDTVFPNIFEHINGFLGNSNFIFKEPEFVRGATEILVLYHNDFVLQNYHLSQDGLSAFITCLVSVLETSDAQSTTTNQLGPILGHALVFRLSCISHIASEGDVVDEVMENKFPADLDTNVTFCLQKQGLILHPVVLNYGHLRSTIELTMGYFLKLSPFKQLELAEHVLNFLRSVIVMRDKEIERLIPQLTQLSDYQNSVHILTEFFSFVATHNDEETVRHIQKVPTVKHIFNKCFHFRLSKMRDIGQISVQDMVQVVLNSSGRLGSINNPQLQGFERDCQTLKSAIITGELMKYNRELQDTSESIRFYSASYSNLKLEIHRVLTESPVAETNLILDYIEGANRMKKLLIGENRLSESEKLSYNVKVPLRPIDSFDIQKAAHLHLDSAFSAFGIHDHSEDSNIDADLEEYEEIDEDGDSTHNHRTSNEDRNRKVLRSLYLGDQIQELYNVSKVNGLDAVESLMILGFSHMYFIEEYFHCSDGNVVDIEEVPHESRDPYLRFIKPQSDEPKHVRSHRVKTWSLESLASICKRKFLLRDIALELFFDDGASLLLTCLSTAQRDKVHTKLRLYTSNESLDKDLQITLEISSSSSEQSQAASASGRHLRSRLMSAFSTSFTSGPTVSEITKKWKMGMMSNFYYLLSINTMAGRTFNDLTQYPIFPWVIADYESEELDLSDPKTYRDLSKPMGAQTSKRAAEYKERYEALASMEDASAPPFHYGTHYSSAMIVSSYLIRLKPYVQSYLLLQGGKFDHADRLFNSVGKVWSSASKENTTDVRELTPEFFYLPEFLVNKNNFEFGKLQNGSRPNDVILPKWAKGDPKIFIAKNREALESAHVSAHLHHWIDLVFGYKQSGPEAIEALNVFHHSSYDGAINLDMIQDDVEKRAVIGMINNFGQTPVRLFSKPHVAKDVLNLPYLQHSVSGPGRNPPVCTFESKLHLPIHKLEVSAKSRKWIGRPSCVSSEDQILVRKPSTGISKSDSGSLFINTTLFMNLHSSNITSLVQIGGKIFLTGSEDGIIQAWKCSVQPTMTLSYYSILRGHLSAIVALCYNKQFKFCLSLDADGAILQWDTSRFKFVRRIAHAMPQDSQMQLLATSNDSGNFCTIHTTKYNNILTVYTLNGEKITQLSLKPGKITAVSFAQINDSLIESIKTDYGHSFWADEIIVLSYSSPQVNLDIYKLEVNKEGWVLSSLEKVDMRSLISGHVTSMQVYKQVEICEDDRLSRGRLMFILGDSKGKVYVW